MTVNRPSETLWRALNASSNISLLRNQPSRRTIHLHEMARRKFPLARLWLVSLLLTLALMTGVLVHLYAQFPLLPATQSQSSRGNMNSNKKYRAEMSQFDTAVAASSADAAADGGGVPLLPDAAPLPPPRVFTCRCYPQVKYAFATRGFSMKTGTDDYEGSWIIWKTGTDIDARRLQQWQRPNHFPGERQLDRKGTMYTVLRQYGTIHGISLEFLPETYLLYTEADKSSYVRRLNDGGGMDQPWVLKRATASRGRGVTMLGPRSLELTELRDQLASGPIKKGHIVQSYIKNEWTFQGHKCDLRVYIVVASVDPLIVYYHDGIVRTAAGLHDEDNFSESKAHLTNVSQNKQNRTVWEPVKTFEDLEEELMHYVQSHTVDKGTAASPSPVQHIRKQIKDIVAIVFAAFKDHISLRKIPPDNAFAVMGADFVIDRNLKVWLLEMQLGPQLLGDNHVKKTAVLQDVLLTTIDLVEEVYQKQVNGQPLLPLRKTGTMELVYTAEHGNNSLSTAV